MIPLSQIVVVDQGAALNLSHPVTSHALRISVLTAVPTLIFATVLAGFVVTIHTHNFEERISIFAPRSAFIQVEVSRVFSLAPGLRPRLVPCSCGWCSTVTWSSLLT
jgi:hypothetical protein